MTRSFVAPILCLLATGSAFAADPGTASGEGVIARLLADGASEAVPFAPQFAYAYDEERGGKRYRWIVLTDTAPPADTWLDSGDHAGQRARWCADGNGSFVAAKLDPAGVVDLYFLCPRGGAVNTEMLSSWNGLESVVFEWEERSAGRMRGSLATGKNSCPAEDGSDAYCEPTGSFRFDAPVLQP